MQITWTDGRFIRRLTGNIGGKIREFIAGCSTLKKDPHPFNEGALVGFAKGI